VTCATPVQWHVLEFLGISLHVGGEDVADKVSVAQAVMEGFAARDVERLIALFTPDTEFQTRVDVIGEPDFKGYEGAREWLAAVDERYDTFEVVDAEYQPGAGDAVVVSCRLRLRHAGDRYGMSRMAYWVIRVDENRGSVAAFTSFRDLRDACAAAGLSGGAGAGRSR
jgi:ketosteroid isomerase-like protein